MMVVAHMNDVVRVRNDNKDHDSMKYSNTVIVVFGVVVPEGKYRQSHRQVLDDADELFEVDLSTMRRWTSRHQVLRQLDATELV